MSALPEFGLGTYKLRNDLCESVVSQALDKNYTAIDTALLYRNQKRIAPCIKKRENVFITSKIIFDDIKKNNISGGYDKILKELDTTKVDLLLLHRPYDDETNLNAWREMEILYGENKVDNIGISNYRISELTSLLKSARIRPMVNQIEISPFNTRKALVKFCKDNGIKVQAYGSLTQGKKLDHITLKEISAKYSITPAQLMLKWALQQDIAVIPRSENSQQLEENIKVTSDTFPEISEGDMQVLNSLDEQFYTIPHYKD